MAVKKFSKYVLKGKAEKKYISGKTPVIPATLEGLKDWGGVHQRIEWKYISKPNILVDEPHSHDFEEFLIFLGNDPADQKTFGGEIEISLGEEGEKHLISTAAVVCIPKGLVHGPLNFKKIGKPIMFAVIYLAPEYVRKPASLKSAKPVKQGAIRYGKYILREPKGEPRKLDTERWGVSITEQITAGAGKFNCNFNFLSILGSHVLPDPPHSHDCDEFLFLMPASYEDWPNLGGEVEIALGEDWERQSITTAAVVCLPKGVQHCPVYMKSVEKPFYWGHMLPVSSYGSSASDPKKPL
jgi:hypothetical protein